MEGLACIRRGAEDCSDVVEFPGLDVIVGRVHAVDVSLDYVAVVADYETVAEEVSFGVD